MASNPRPPQLELELGHPGFKRSFQQFGLDVDDGDDIDASSSSSSNSSSTLASSSSASGSGSNGTGSSSRTSSSSQAGHSGHSGHAANKRARSEGPETSNHAAGLSQSQGSTASSSSDLSYTTAASVLGDDDDDDDVNERGSASSPHSQPSPPDIHTEPNTFLTSLRRPNNNTVTTSANSDTPPSLGPLPFVFEPPPTPSIADFAAARSSRNGSIRDARSIVNPQPRIPGFSGMRSPRSSSPAPPPLLDVDVPMRESIEEDEALRSFIIPLSVPQPQTRRENEVPPPRSSQAHIHGFAHSENQTRRLSQFEREAQDLEVQVALDQVMYGSPDELRNATDRLRSVLARAQEFDRTLAPLRVETDLEAATTDSSDPTSTMSRRAQAQTQPRLPPFEFEIPSASGNSSSGTGSRSGSGRTLSPPFSNLPSRDTMANLYAVGLPNSSSRVQASTTDASPPRPTSRVSVSGSALEGYLRFNSDSTATAVPNLDLDRNPFTDLSAARLSRVRETHPTPSWLQNWRQGNLSSLLRGEERERRQDSMFASTWMDGYVEPNMSMQSSSSLRRRLTSMDNSNTRARENAGTGGSSANRAGNQGRNPTANFSSLISARLRDLQRASNHAEWTVSNMNGSAHSNIEDTQRRSFANSSSNTTRPGSRTADLWDMGQRVDQLVRRVGDVRRDTEDLQAQTAQIQRRADDVQRRTAIMAYRTRRMTEEVPDILEFNSLSTAPYETSFANAARPNRTFLGSRDAESEPLPHLFSGDAQTRGEGSESSNNAGDAHRLTSSAGAAGALSTRESNWAWSRQERSHFPPTLSAGATLQTQTSMVEPQRASFPGMERDRPQAVSDSFDAGSAVNLSFEASLRRRYPFEDEDPPSHRPRPGSSASGTGREHDASPNGSMPSFLDRIRSSLPSRSTTTSTSSMTRPSASGGDAMSDVFELRRVRQQREASLQRRITRSPPPPATQPSWGAQTLSLDLSFESNLYPSFTASVSNSAAASQATPVPAPAPAPTQAPSQRTPRRVSPIFIPPPPSASDLANNMQLPRLHSSVFEPLTISPSLSDLVDADEHIAASRTRPAPVPAVPVASTTGFMPRNQRERNDQESDVANRLSWLQPERTDNSAAMDVERQRPAPTNSIRSARASRNGDVWSLMDDEEILSPRDGLFSSIQTLHPTLPNETRNSEEPRPRARTETDGLSRSLADFDQFRQQSEEVDRESERSDRNRESEMQALRQAVTWSNTRIAWSNARIARLRQLSESYQRNAVESRDGRNNVGNVNSTGIGQRRPLSAIDSLTGGYPSWMQDAADWEVNLEHLDRTEGSTSTFTRTNERSGSSSTSTEAAAFFASGPTIDGERRPSPQLLRQRRLRLSGLGGLSLSQDSDTVGPLGSNSPRLSPSISGRRGTSDELESVLFPPRDTQPDERREMRAQYQGGAFSAGADVLIHIDTDSPFTERRRIPDETNFGLSAATSRRGPPPQPNMLHQQTGNARTQPQTTSRPPVLPPIGALEDTEALGTLRRLADEFIPERRRPASPNYEATRERLRSQHQSVSNPDPHDAALLSFTDAVLSPNTNTEQQRGGNLAMHRALVLRSVRNRGTASEAVDEVLRNAEAITTRAGGSIQQTLETLGADAEGPSLTRRQLFQQAQERSRADREREREQERERERDRERRRLMRPEPHVRWGEVHDDPEAHGRSPAYRTIRSRTRRSSLSTIFAPPLPDTSSSTASLESRTGGSAAGFGTGSSLNIGGGTNRHAEEHDELRSLLNSTQRTRNARLMNLSSQRMRESRDETLSRSFFRRSNRMRVGLDSFGDFVRDEDFDASYESLIALAASLGEVKPRATPSEVLEALPNGLYKDWQTPGCDTRCPICLDDYKDVDMLLKAEPCNHWCHKDCFEQWLHTANTCPVCRSKITSQRASASSRSSQPVAGPSGTRRSTPSGTTPSLMDRISAASRSGASAAASVNIPTSTSAAAASRSRMQPLPLQLARRVSPFGNANTNASTSDEGSHSGSSSGSSSSAVSLSGLLEGEREVNEDGRDAAGDDSDSDSDFLSNAAPLLGMWTLSGATGREGLRSFQFGALSRDNRDDGERDE